MLPSTTQARYEQTEAGKATRRRYRSSPKGKVRRAASAKRYYERRREQVLTRVARYDARRKEERQLYDKARRGRSKAIQFWVNQAREAV